MYTPEQEESNSLSVVGGAPWPSNRGGSCPDCFSSPFCPCPPPVKLPISVNRFSKLAVMNGVRVMSTETVYEFGIDTDVKK